MLYSLIRCQAIESKCGLSSTPAPMKVFFTTFTHHCVLKLNRKKHFCYTNLTCNMLNFLHLAYQCRLVLQPKFGCSLSAVLKAVLKFLRKAWVFFISTPYKEAILSYWTWGGIRKRINVPVKSNVINL